MDLIQQKYLHSQYPQGLLGLQDLPALRVQMDLLVLPVQRDRRDQRDLRVQPDLMEIPDLLVLRVQQVARDLRVQPDLPVLRQGLEHLRLLLVLLL